MADVTKESLVEAIRAVAARRGTTVVGRDVFLKEAEVSERQLLRLFGSYNALVEAAGLTPQRFPTAEEPKYSEREMIDDVLRVLRLPGAKPTKLFFEINGRISSRALERRFGNWRAVVKAVVPLLDEATDSALRHKLVEYTTVDGEPAVTSANGASASEYHHPGNEPETTEAEHPDEAESIAPPVVSTNVYGDFINFRGLQHAPVNEQGVVFLFGMVCRELGYVVEIVRQGFPDCEAKRRIAGRPGQWQRVRIEFEYQSRNFRRHGHDPDQCDVIVCWEDNWPDCPLEVVELKSAIAMLPPGVS